ncbi:DUF4279 domain-containing protein [Paraburkholderia gardini]|uniref:DUF4279 domain-containing protein n=1 Tax=Paraburkholderia gardini TaxID=2823469 RepID=UPI001E2C85B0|nr:DUF4279 domain-containing protein [Paraburkholderia gardini]
MKHHLLAHATFTITGDAVQPEYWTKYFDVEPDLAISKDLPFVTPSGRPQRGVVGVWGIYSKGEVKSDSLDPHLRYLIKHLDLPRADLPVLVNEVGAKMRFFCYWYNETGNRKPEIASDISELASLLGISIEIDEYPGPW